MYLSIILKQINVAIMHLRISSVSHRDEKAQRDLTSPLDYKKQNSVLFFTNSVL